MPRKPKGPTPVRVPKPPRRKHVTRAIYFFRIDAGKDVAGLPKTWDPALLLQHIDSQAGTDDRYWPYPRGVDTCCWSDGMRDINDASFCCIKIGNIRREGFPKVEHAGVLSDLNIPDPSGLAELTHIVFCPNGIVGCESNFHGPRITRLEGYILNKGKGVVAPVKFNPLLRDDASLYLNRAAGVSMLKIAINSTHVEDLAPIDGNLRDALKVQAKALGIAVDEVQPLEIALRPVSALHRADLLGKVKAFYQNAQFRKSALEFKVEYVEGETERKFDIDLLNDKLVANKKLKIELGRTKAVESSSAFEAIIEAYWELKDELETASVLVVESQPITLPVDPSV